MHAPPTVFYKLNGFNQFIWKSHYLKSSVVPGLHPGKILGTQVTTKNKLTAGGGGHETSADDTTSVGYVWIHTIIKDHRM